MFWPFRRRRPPGDPVEFNRALPLPKIGYYYTRMDRYRDFRRTFSTPEGKRVLAQIIDHCKVFANKLDIENPNATYFHAGKREVGLMILHVMNTEPLDEPEIKAQEKRRG